MNRAATADQIRSILCPYATDAMREKRFFAAFFALVTSSVDRVAAKLSANLVAFVAFLSLGAIRARSRASTSAS